MDFRNNFYSSGLGDSLVDETKYPDEIISYLSLEQELVSSLVGRFDVIVEVGCMNGRYLNWAMRKGKKYLGVDIVERYVKDGQERASRLLPKGSFRVEICDATLIHLIPEEKGWISKNNKTLLLFPFNSFGNMSKYELVINSLFESRYPFVICSYLTNKYSTFARQQYYENCGYSNVKRIIDHRGVRFLSDDGLDTVAYEPKYVEHIFRKKGIEIKTIVFSGIGVAYLGNF